LIRHSGLDGIAPLNVRNEGTNFGPIRKLSEDKKIPQGRACPLRMGLNGLIRSGYKLAYAKAGETEGSCAEQQET
jgi:hypothetical protein